MPSATSVRRGVAARRACHNRRSRVGRATPPNRPSAVTPAPDRPTLLLAIALPAPFLDALREPYDVVGPIDPPFERNAQEIAPAIAARVRALVTMGTVGASAAVVARLPRLEIVCCTGSGYEKVDLAACAARGIAVTHGRAVNADSVADVALGLLIASVRRFTQGRALLASGAWAGNAARNMPLVRGLTGLRVGVYGLGEIGARIARRAAACGCTIGYHGRAARPGVDYPFFATLHALADWADALVVSVRADAANRHAVDATILRALGPQGHVVNIARGSVIDERALIDALRDGALAGAGLDVFEHEPDVPAELLALENAVLTPHFGGGTLEAQGAMQALVVQNLEAFFAGRAPLTPVPAASIG